MRLFILIVFCILVAMAGCNAQGEEFTNSVLTTNQVAKISSAIWKLEGGANTKFPYGIKSIDVKGDAPRAKRICENTIRNNFARWNKTKKHIDFLTYLANVYCPSAADPVGNRNWIRNIHKLTN
jgi:hypothetical protein